MRLLGGLLAVLVLAACAEKRMPLTSVAEVQHNEPQVGDTTLMRRGSQIVEVRTFVRKLKSDEEVAKATFSTGEVEGPGQTRVTEEIEIAEATCILKGDRFAAEVVTPAGVRVPLYGYQSGALTLECSKDGFEPGIAVVEPYNKTFAERRQGAAGGGLLGALLIEIINAASDETNDEFEYWFTPVILEEIVAQSS